MTISVTIVSLQVPYGNPGSVGEPLGIWTAKAVLTGDATGGHIETIFVPQNPTTTPTLDDQRRQYVWFLDAAGIITDALGVLNMSARMQTHWARSNAALTNPLDMINVLDSVSDGLNVAPFQGPLVPAAWQRIPIFWDTQELAAGNSVLVQLLAESNVNGVQYTFSAYGRYYDRQVLSNRAFGRLISPVAVSQFEG